ncbi:nucleotidyl transferase AbiEii/AbiGii toxin family protein [Candidatus Poriferisodalis sp.]|uniref:nucleotidyl transferase AbiEii/AbiGii toxin family protein n=1 Tax=Candidatus Poriferisodalis sp. TaxID=3101277 RepID=UPI003C7011C7
MKLETSLLHATGELAASCEVNSLLARRGDPGSVGRFPELGGFELPCVRPWWTAVNKLDALHRRAATGDLDGLRARGRDLYDLWSIATQRTHAAQTREQAPQMWRTASAAVRAPTPRPRHGCGTSPAFTESTPAYQALRDGYHRALDATVWGAKPRFETAAKAARSLDTTDHD